MAKTNALSRRVVTGLLAPDSDRSGGLGRVWPKVAPDYLSDIGMFAANPLDENAREYAKATLLDLDQSLAGQHLNPPCHRTLGSRMRASSMPLNSVPIGISSDAGWNSRPVPSPRVLLSGRRLRPARSRSGTGLLIFRKVGRYGASDRTSWPSAHLPDPWRWPGDEPRTDVGPVQWHSAGCGGRAMRLSRIAAVARSDGQGLWCGEDQRARRHAGWRQDGAWRQDRDGRSDPEIRLIWPRPER